MPTAIAAFVVVSLLASGVTDVSPTSTARLRAADAGADALIDAALTRSETVKRLAAEIEVSDLIVYVSETNSLRSELSGALRFMGAGARDRFLRIDVRPCDPGSATSLIAAIATLAHELLHALEVAGARHVIDELSFTQFYREVADKPHAAVVDTRAAREIGQRVHFELTGRRQ